MVEYYNALPAFQFFFNQDFGHDVLRTLALSLEEQKHFQFFFNQDFGHVVDYGDNLVRGRKGFQFFFNQDFGHGGWMATVRGDDDHAFFQFFFNQDFGHAVPKPRPNSRVEQAFNSFLIKILVMGRSRTWTSKGTCGLSILF